MRKMSGKKIENKLHSLFFSMRLFVNGKMGLPAQTRQEIGIFKAVFGGIARDAVKEGKRINIFEWGSGFSTLYYASYLRKRRIRFKWDSIDNNRLWYEKIKTEVQSAYLDSIIDLHLCEFKPFWEKPNWGPVPPPCGAFSPKTENEKDYVRFPEKLKEFFDVVIIDARFRRHCVETAKEVLAPKGVVVMHDAQKPHYHMGLDQFRHSIFLEGGKWHPFQNETNKIWIGSNGASSLISQLNDPQEIFRK